MTMVLPNNPDFVSGRTGEFVTQTKGKRLATVLLAPPPVALAPGARRELFGHVPLDAGAADTKTVREMASHSIRLQLC